MVAALIAFAMSMPAGASGLFSVDGLDGWEAQLFRNKMPTRYRIVDDRGVRVLRADCSASASGLIRRERVDLGRTPILQWRWRTRALLTGTNEREKSGDDFALRVYVVRDGGWALWRTRSLVYVWSNGESSGDHWPNPYTDNAHVVIVRRGPQQVGEWVEETRDVRADFATYLGLRYDAVDGVALMSDCDDTGAEVRAWYGDIRWTTR